ncbi:hypothetical protein CTZ27_37035 [Streptomyces griseocarneus]|nr:hypothetical protein CTZ27_37035 [Streptomyces griseocarneus]
MTTVPRPLLFLDVDGPLNPWDAKPTRRPADYQTHRLRPTGWKPHESRKPLRVWLNPSHGPALLALPFELIWATTWGTEANEMIGPRIGLPDLPVVPWPTGAGRSRQDTPDGTFWKTAHLVEYAANRPFAWVDDDLDPLDAKYVATHHDGPALLHRISPKSGLLPQDFEALTAWSQAPTRPTVP